MNKLIYIILILSILFTSCTKEKNYDVSNNRIVKISGIGYTFETITTKGRENKTIVASAHADYDDENIIIAELIDAGKNVDTRADVLEYQKVNSLKALTFYYPETNKKESRIQDVDLVNKTFELPSEGMCDVVFYSHPESGSFSGLALSSDKRSVSETVQSGTNICYTVSSFNKIPKSVDLSRMTPLFSQIERMVVAENTSDNWKMSMSNIKLLTGCQENALVTIGGDKAAYSVTYNKVDTDYVIAMTDLNTIKNIIPNNNNFSIQATIALNNKTVGSGTLTFNFNTPLEPGKKYLINLTVKRKGIHVKFYVNTQQRGVYNQSFDEAQQVTVKANNPNALTDANNTTTKSAYFKYGEVITLPAAPQRESNDAFDPNNFMKFYKWSKNSDCKSGLQNSTITLTVDNFPELKTSDEIILYAYFRPMFYYWNSPIPAFEGGNEVSAIPNSLKATIPLFNNVPTAEDFKKYLGYNCVIFYDNGLTGDQQQGYWVKKWDISSRNGSMYNTARTVSNSTGVEVVTVKQTITNGVFPSGYNRSDYFFLPILGFYYPSKSTDVPYGLEEDNLGGVIDGAIWSSDVLRVYGWDGSSYVTNYISQGISLTSNGGGIRLYGIANQSYTYGFLAKTNTNQSSAKNALLVYWADNTYSK
jgi:hypothetical protein